jgi:hypothetical protein
VSAINAYLLDNDIRINANPCVSPDFCLDWPALSAKLEAGAAAKAWPELITYEASRFAIAVGQVRLMEDPSTGDHAWFVDGGPVDGLSDGLHLGGQRHAYPATWANLLVLKDRILAYDPESCIFPVARGSLAHSSIGVGARFTTLHWPAVEWAMAELGVSLTANQNSIPRELVYDVDEMLADRLMQVRFPFIGADVPEGHQGQSIEGMSQGSVLSKLKTGFHKRRIPWGFNADHQPVGGHFKSRAEALVRGSLLATYITFDLSPELMATEVPDSAEEVAAIFTKDIPAELAEKIRSRVAGVGIELDGGEFQRLMVSVWPAIQEMKDLDGLYRSYRENHFSTEVARAYFRELSIDELPGLTTPATMATMLALVEALDMPVNYVAPAFGFQKNFPFEDNEELERRVSAAWTVCDAFGVSIGFHSGSGKSAENYQLCGRITGSKLEIKTSGRYTYEMGVALHASSDPADQALWSDWYAFTRDLALASAFSDDETEAEMAQSFIQHALELDGSWEPAIFASEGSARAALLGLTPSPDHMFWFEYNFLFVLAAGGAAEKAALGDHGPAGYGQRARFYAIADEGQLKYAQGVARYLCFLCKTCGLASSEACAAATAKLDGYSSYGDLLAAIDG